MAFSPYIIVLATCLFTMSLLLEIRDTGWNAGTIAIFGAKMMIKTKVSATGHCK